MPTELVTIAGVPILETGTYDLSTGERTFAEEDLAAAAAAFANDPAVKAPRVKIGGLAASFDPAEHGGEPAFGWFDNLQVVNAGQTLVGDAHVPQWLADVAEWAYPARSIEGTPPGWTSATGQQHEFVVTAVALLGVDLPGVSTLDDLAEVLANGPAAEETADAEAAVVASAPRRGARVAAGLDQDLVVRPFYEAVDRGEVELPDGVEAGWSLWVRAMRFDDDGTAYLKVADDATGRLYRVDFEVSGAEVAFGEFVEVVETDTPVAAAGSSVPVTLRAWSSRDESRAHRAEAEEDEPMNDEQRRALALALGQPEDTPEERLHEVASARAAEQGREGGEPDPAAPPEADGGEGGGEPTPPNPAERVEQPAAAAVPEGMRLVDAETFAELQAGAQAGTAARRRQEEADRDAVLAQAQRDGRFPPARREHYAEAWARDPEGTRHLLTATPEEGGLAPGLVPVAARGAETSEGGEAEGADHAAYMRTHFPQAAAALERRRGGVRHRSEV